MIEIPRNLEQVSDFRIKIVGIGGAGCNALDRMMLDGAEKVDLLALNTDVQALASCVASEKIQIGRTATRGLGTGGDPELGQDAAHEALDEIRPALDGANMVFLCVGLGGGTGSGAAPIVAEIARENGSLVIVFATLPFGFEGRRRSRQAQEALSALERTAHAVICFENDRMGDTVSPKAGIHQAFAMADQIISQSVRSVSRLVMHRGLINIGFDDLLSALRNRHARCLFGHGEADGDNRANECLTRALKSPLLDRGRLLNDAASVLVNIVGGPSMTLYEVQVLMEEIGRHIADDTQILFGAAVDPRMGQVMTVSLISSLCAPEGVASPLPEATGIHRTNGHATTGHADPRPIEPAEPAHAPLTVAASLAEPEPEPEREAVAEAVTQPEPRPDEELEIPAEPIEAGIQDPEEQSDSGEETPAAAAEADLEHEEAEAEAELAAAALETRMHAPDRSPVPVLPPARRAAKAPQLRQETLQFEPATRGRFEKSEPTIIDGEDLDVPTFLRKNVRVK